MANAAYTELTKVFTVIGVNFVYTDFTPSTRLAAAACDTISWTSSTSTYCSGALASPIVATIGGRVGTRSFTFTYDGSHILPTC